MHVRAIGYAGAALSILIAAATGCGAFAADGATAREDGGEGSGQGTQTSPADTKTTTPDGGGTAPAPPSGGGAGGGAGAGVKAQGCITDVTAGQHRFTCDGLAYDVTVPAACAAGGCGLVVDVHGLTMNAEIEDLNTNMRALGERHGYVVVQPNANVMPPPLAVTSWNPATDDEKVVATATLVKSALAIDPKRAHITGFSAGAAMAFRILCKHTGAFASIAAAAGTGCTFKPGDTPSREVPVLYMQGARDNLESYASSAIPQRDNITRGWKLGAGTKVAGGASFTRTRFVSPSGTPFEFLQHDYVAFSFVLGGHCYPGSADQGARGTTKGQLMSFGCTGQTAFRWGEEAMAFFMAHPGK